MTSLRIDDDARSSYDRSVPDLHSTALVLMLAWSVGPCTAESEQPEAVTVPMVLVLPIPEVCEDHPITRSCDPPPCCAGDRFAELRAQVAAECATMGGDRLEVGGHGCDVQCKVEDGRKHGPGVRWYNTGHPHDKAYYRLGERAGLTRVWHENGQLASEIPWGEPGCARQWDPEGNLIAEHCDK